MGTRGVCLVTGGAGAMGSACGARLARDGYAVALMDIKSDGLHAAKARIGGETQSWHVDQTDEAAVRSAVADIEKKMGPIVALANTIGWTNGTKYIDETSEYWHRIVAINYLSALYVTHGGEAVYAGAKAAEVAFAKSIARENARFNIRVNCTAPGATESPLMRDTEKQYPSMIEKMVKAVPFRRLGTPEEQADVVSFLLSDDARWITGQCISTSGGLTMC